MKLLLATQKDIPNISPLYRSLFESVAELEPYFFKEAEQDSSFLETTVNSDDSDIIMAVMNDQVVGFALIQLQETPPYNVYQKHQFAYLIDLITKSQHRGKGVATALLEECEAWSKRKGAEYLELSVLTKNSNAYELYLKQGFSEKMTTLYKAIN